MEQKNVQYDYFEVNPADEDWRLIESSADSTVFHSRAWVDYIRRIGYKPYVLSVYRQGEKIGYFVGEKVWRGVRIVAAPFEGLGTYTQGLVFFDPVSKDERLDVYQALFAWLKQNRKASYLQVDDWDLRVDYPEVNYYLATRNPLLVRRGIMHDIRPTLHLDLKKSEDELWKGLHYKSCKYCINKARKLGLQLEVVDRYEDIKDFVKVHHAQVVDVCRRKGTKPKTMQGKGRMLTLCQSLFPDRILMVKVVGNDDSGVRQVMSTGIFCLDKGQSTYWTGASFQQYMKYCPNELMVWEAVRILHERGAGDLNFCGMAHYKLKFGTVYAYVPRMIFTEHKWMDKAKKWAKRTVRKLGLKR